MIVNTLFWPILPDYLVFALGIILLGLAAYGILKLVQNYLIGTSKDRALKSLQELVVKVEQGTREPQVVYQQLTAITKGFSQWRYGIPPGVTDYELLKRLVKTECPPKSKKEIERIIHEAQVIKFGQLVGPRRQVIQDIQAVRSYIEQVGDPDK